MTRTLATLATVAALGLSSTNTADAGHCHRTRHHQGVVRVVEPAPIYVHPAPICTAPPAPLVIAAPAPLPLIPPAPALNPAFNPALSPALNPAANAAPQSQVAPALAPQRPNGLAPQAPPQAAPATLPQPAQSANAPFRNVAINNANSSALSAQLDALAQAGPAGLNPALAPLVGNWEALIAGPQETSQRILLSIQADGMASLSIPTSSTGSTTIARRMVLKQGLLRLEDVRESMSLGRLLQADANQLVLERSGGRLNFVRK